MPDNEPLTSGPGFAAAPGDPRAPCGPTALPTSWGLRAAPAAPATVHPALRATRADGGGYGATQVVTKSFTGQARPRTPEASLAQPPATPPSPVQTQAPRAGPLPRPPPRRAAHQPPLGNVSPGRGGRGSHDCACAPDRSSSAPA